MIRHVLVPVADGIEEIEAVTIIDVLRRAGASVTVASVDQFQVTASRGVQLVADKLIRDCVGSVYDLIALPGGMPGAEHLRDSADLVEMIRSQKMEGRYYAAICASPAVVLAHHDLLGDCKATCHPNHLNRLKHPVPVERRVVVDGNCITSCAPGTAMEFALKLVEILYGREKAEETAAPMLVQF